MGDRHADPPPPGPAPRRSLEHAGPDALLGRVQCHRLAGLARPFLRPPARLTTARYTPELGRLEMHGATVLFRTTSPRARFWLRRIDRWVQYANSVIEE